MKCINDILATFREIDEGVLLSINHCHEPWLDNVMWLISDRWFWIPFYLLLLVLLLRFCGVKRTIVILLFIAVAITATDQFCASVLRPWIARLRPSNPDNPVCNMIHLVNGYTGGEYGFPSCHAANTMALATFMSLVCKSAKITVLMLLWSFLTSISRSYLGVHYPTDILAGWIVGFLISIVLYNLYKWLSRHLDIFNISRIL